MMNWFFSSGPAAALAAAALWAASSLIYSRVRLSAWELNFGKNVVASVALLLIWLAGRGSAQLSMPADFRTVLLLALSSLLGIVLGDTLYFRSLQILGPRHALMLSTTSPLFGLAFGTLLLNQFLTVANLVGIALTLIGIVAVILERGGRSDAAGYHGGTTTIAVLLGLAAAASTAVGGMLSHMATHDSASGSGCSAFDATVIRVVTAAVTTGLLLSFRRSLHQTSARVFAPSLLKSYLPAVVMGPILGIWMSQIALQKSLLAVAITLTSTAPLFAMPLARIVFGTPVTARALLGALVAIAGVSLVGSDPSDLRSFLAVLVGWSE